MSIVEYWIGVDPIEKGTYACRVPMDDAPSGWLEDKFLFWDGHRWGYPSSDQRYRGEVIGWIGPLRRQLKGEAI